MQNKSFDSLKLMNVTGDQSAINVLPVVSGPNISSQCVTAIDPPPISHPSLDDEVDLSSQDILHFPADVSLDQASLLIL